MSDEDREVAMALWKQDQRPALVEVWCLKRQHRLGKVFKLPVGHRLATPEFTILDADLYTEAAESASVATVHPALYKLEGDQRILLRCGCHTFTVDKAALRDAVVEAKATGATRQLVADLSWRSVVQHLPD